MAEELTDIHYSPIRDYNYEYWFKSIDPNGKTLSNEERKEFLAYVNEAVSQYSSGLPIIHDSLENSRNCNDEFHEIEHTVSSVILFVLVTSIDCMVAGKYFMMADTDYDRSFMRGKMRIILNEGFKRLFGFDSKTHNKSEWHRLEPLMSHFPSIIQKRYAELSHRLEEHSKSSSWWRNERNLETHLEAENLYLSRMEDVIESKVMMDSLKLFNTLQAANEFLTNVHACLLNFLVGKYKGGELSISNE